MKAKQVKQEWNAPSKRYGGVMTYEGRQPVFFELHAGCRYELARQNRLAAEVQNARTGSV